MFVIWISGSLAVKKVRLYDNMITIEASTKIVNCTALGFVALVCQVGT